MTAKLVSDQRIGVTCHRIKTVLNGFLHHHLCISSGGVVCPRHVSKQHNVASNASYNERVIFLFH